MDGGTTEYTYDADLSNWGFGTAGDGVVACNYNPDAEEDAGAGASGSSGSAPCQRRGSSSSDIPVRMSVLQWSWFSF